MNRPSSSNFWIEYEPEPPANVVYLNKAHARANAAHAAMLLEADREATRNDLRRDLQARRRELMDEVKRVDEVLAELDRCTHG
jgi:hypothetical protein